MASTPKQMLNAQTLVGLLSRLMRMDMPTVACVAGVPLKNMQAWITGRRQALRLSSIVAILHTVGIRIDALRTILDAQRVHFWDVHLPAFGRGEPALATLTALSKLLQNGYITEVQTTRKVASLRERLFRRYFLIAGLGPTAQPFKVVVTLHTYPWRKLRITPEIIKGAVWRDDNDHHCLPVRADAWKAITTKDMTVREFDQAFENAATKFSWPDVILMAREFGVGAEDVAEHILETRGNETKAGVGPSAADEVPLRFLLGNAA